MTNPWYYQDQPFLENEEKYEGFVYLITNLLNNRKYIGKKSFWQRRMQKTGKRKTLESDWKKYYSSSDELKNDVKIHGESNFSRVILRLCSYKKEMSFHEQFEQWKNNVLLTDDYYNTNIGGKFFVRERNIYYYKKEITTKNDNWRKIASERMTGENNIAKREDVRKKISEKKKGENHHQYGKPISEDHKKALREGHKKMIEEHSGTNYFGRPIGSKVSAEGRKNMSEASKLREAKKRLARQSNQ